MDNLETLVDALDTASEAAYRQPGLHYHRLYKILQTAKRLVATEEDEALASWTFKVNKIHK